MYKKLYNEMKYVSKKQTKRIVVGNIYRPPIINKWRIEKIELKNLVQIVIVLGDYNLDFKN